MSEFDEPDMTFAATPTSLSTPYNAAASLYDLDQNTTAAELGMFCTTLLSVRVGSQLQITLPDVVFGGICAV